MKRTGNLMVVCAAVLVVACDAGRRDTSTIQDDSAAIGTAGVTGDDTRFVEQSLAAGVAEVELGKVAQERAANNEVRQFAEMMVRDHTRSGNELRQIAQQHAVATQPDPEHRDMMDRLSALQGAEFDREYMSEMVRRHEAMVDHLEGRADDDRFGAERGTPQPGTTGGRPIEASINQWAASVLPIARQHLDEARRISDGLGRR